MKPSTDTTLCITTLPITSPIVNLWVETGSGVGTHRLSRRAVHAVGDAGVLGGRFVGARDHHAVAARPLAV